MAARTLWASEYAVDQFRAHWCPGFALPHAKRELIVLCESARRTDTRNHDGKEIWRAGTGGEVRLIVAQDVDRRGMRKVVTVLGPELAATSLA